MKLPLTFRFSIHLPLLEAAVPVESAIRRRVLPSAVSTGIRFPYAVAAWAQVHLGMVTWVGLGLMPINRNRGAVKAVRTKTEKIRRWASTMPIRHNFPASLDGVMRPGRRSALQRTFQTNRPSYHLAPDERLAVNYLRHECTSYDGHLEDSFGVVGTNLAHAIIKNRILRRIGETFPELEAEARRQMIQETGQEPRSVRAALYDRV